MQFPRLTHLTTLLLLLAGCLAAQSKRPDDLAPGAMLVAPRDSPDPHFAETVILLVRYDATGALGLMLNRQTTVPISRALKEITSAAGHSDPVFVGGPVELDTVFALARKPHNPEGATAVVGETYFIAAKSVLEKALGGDTGPSGFRIYIGYCGWAPHQLENEVRLGGWYIFNHSDALAFDAEPSKLWNKLIGKAESQMVRLHYPPTLEARVPTLADRVPTITRLTTTRRIEPKQNLLESRQNAGRLGPLFN